MLHKPCRERDLSAVKELLTQPAIDINATSKEGYTALEDFMRRCRRYSRKKECKAIEDQFAFQNLITLLQNTDVALTNNDIYTVIKDLYGHTNPLDVSFSIKIREEKKFFKENYSFAINTLAMHYGFGILRKSIAHDPSRIYYTHRLKFIEKCIDFLWNSSSQDEHALDFNKMNLLTIGFLRKISQNLNPRKQIDIFSKHITAYSPDFSSMLFSSIASYKYDKHVDQDLKKPDLSYQLLNNRRHIEEEKWLSSTGVLLPPIASFLSHCLKSA